MTEAGLKTGPVLICAKNCLPLNASNEKVIPGPRGIYSG